MPVAYFHNAMETASSNYTLRHTTSNARIEICLFCIGSTGTTGIAISFIQRASTSGSGPVSIRKMDTTNSTASIATANSTAGTATGAKLVELYTSGASVSTPTLIGFMVGCRPIIRNGENMTCGSAGTRRIAIYWAEYT